jgi:hypothetical protein
MQDTIIETAIIPEPEVQAAEQSEAQADDTVLETQLTEEITTLWSDHLRLHADHKITARELRQIRATLAERLYRMKAILCSPGRGGQWRSWLQKYKIPRSTGDRLVQRHAEIVSSGDKNVPSGASSDPVDQLLQSLLPRLRKILISQETIYQFVSKLMEAIKRDGMECWENGVFIFTTDAEAHAALQTATLQDVQSPSASLNV